MKLLDKLRCLFLPPLLYSRDCSINFLAKPKRRWERITLILVTCPCGMPSAGSSSLYDEWDCKKVVSNQWPFFSLWQGEHTFLPRCIQQPYLYHLLQRKTIEARSKRDKSLIVKMRLINLISYCSLSPTSLSLSSKRTISHRIIFWQVVQIAILHAQLIIDLFVYVGKDAG